jgi:hypothetical protein
MTEGDIAVYPSKQDRHSAGFCQTNDVFIVDGELFVEPGFELCESARQFLVRREHLALLHEGAHDPDVDGDRAVAFEHGRQHGDSLLCESVGSVATAAALGV